jgi:hypothetical protein
METISPVSLLQLMTLIIIATILILAYREFKALHKAEDIKRFKPQYPLTPDECESPGKDPYEPIRDDLEAAYNALIASSYRIQNSDHEQKHLIANQIQFYAKSIAEIEKSFKGNPIMEDLDENPVYLRNTQS